MTPTNGPRVCATICSCGDEPATALDSWTGEPIGEDCASFSSRVLTRPLTLDDIASVLRDAVTKDGPDDRREIQGDAIDRLAGLLAYQMRRIADLEATVAKLAGEAS
jgi:hypothetical protein